MTVQQLQAATIARGQMADSAEDNVVLELKKIKKTCNRVQQILLHDKLSSLELSVHPLISTDRQLVLIHKVNQGNRQHQQGQMT